jgi:hypothetical protein
VLILIGVYITLWLLIRTGLISLNQAVTLGEREGDKTYFSFDPSNTISTDGYLLMDTTLSFRTPQSNLVDPSKPYRSVKTLRAYDCRNKAMGDVQVKAFYSAESAKGEVVLEGDDEPLPLEKVEFKSTVPGSRGAQMVRIVCSDVSRTRIWWELFKAKIVGGGLDLPGARQ